MRKLHPAFTTFAAIMTLAFSVGDAGAQQPRFGRDSDASDQGPRWRAEQGDRYYTGERWRERRGERGEGRDRGGWRSQESDEGTTYGRGGYGMGAARDRAGRGARTEAPVVGMSPGMMTIMFTLMDSDGDGVLSESEFQSAHARMFKVLDQNKDGRLSLEEMERFLEARSMLAHRMKSSGQDKGTVGEGQPTEQAPIQDPPRQKEMPSQQREQTQD
jgi:hypothetical protein